MFRAWADRWGVRPEALEELYHILAEPARVIPQPKGGPEALLQSQLRAYASLQGGLLWRNNVGSLPDATGVPVRYGLCNESKRVNDRVKSSDLVGIDKRGRFLAVEVKAPGWSFRNTPREAAQLRFLNIVNARGGVGLFATSTRDLERVF